MPAASNPEAAVREAGPPADGDPKRAWKIVRIYRRTVYKLRIILRKQKVLYDVREIDPRVRFHSRDLGFHYMYHPRQTWAHPETDAEGFSILHIGGRWHRQPLTHCHMTMVHFHRHLETGDPEAKQRFLRGADLLLATRTPVVLAGTPCDVWYYDFQVPSYAPHAVPWICGLGQSWAISVLCRAAQVTGREDYLDAARGAMRVYQVPVEDGGMLGRDAEGHVYYEEYPLPGKVRHVLNGFMSSLLGLYDLHRATGEPEPKRLFDEGIATLTADGVLDRYDLGYCSAYDQTSQRGIAPSFVRYNLVHVRDLIILYRITGIELFRDRAERWYAYSQKPQYRFRCFLEALAWRLRNVPRYVKEAFTVS